MLFSPVILDKHNLISFLFFLFCPTRCTRTAAAACPMSSPQAHVSVHHSHIQDSTMALARFRARSPDGHFRKSASDPSAVSQLLGTCTTQAPARPVHSDDTWWPNTTPLAYRSVQCTIHIPTHPMHSDTWWHSTSQKTGYNGPENGGSWRNRSPSVWTKQLPPSTAFHFWNPPQAIQHYVKMEPRWWEKGAGPRSGCEHRKGTAQKSCLNPFIASSACKVHTWKPAVQECCIAAVSSKPLTQSSSYIPQFKFLETDRS